MEKYENIIKMEEIRRLVDDNQYRKAMKILDTIDFNKIKSITDLSIIAEVLIQNEQYDSAMQVLIKIYSRTKTRRILYQMIDLSIKQGNANEAEDYLVQYIKVAPRDCYRFIFRYRIDKLKGEPYVVLMTSLEQLKEYEYIEKWAYELAKLYHKAGMKDKCICECSDIVLWFGEGLYVEKAKLLKAYYVGELDPIHILKAKEKREAEKKLGLDKTKDYSTIKSQIDHYLAEDEAAKASKEKDNTSLDTDQEKEAELTSLDAEQDEMLQIWDENEELGSEDQEPEESEAEELGSEDQEPEESEAEELGSEDQEPEESEAEDLESEESEFEEPVNDNLDDTIKQFTQEQMEDVKGQVNQDDLENHDDGNISNHDGISELKQIIQASGMDYEKELGFYSHIPDCRTQIESYLKSIIEPYKKSIHLVITGDYNSGKATLGQRITKILHGLKWANTSKVAKITGKKLNRVKLVQKSCILMDCSLIIEEAGSIERDTAVELLQLMETLRGHLVVILEDTESRIQILFENNPNLAEVFQSQIDLPNYTKEDLYSIAKYYVEDNDYQLSEDGKDELIKLIGMMDDDKSNSLGNVLELVNKAKISADERNKKILSSIIGSRDLNSKDFLFIKAEDFR